MAVQALRSISYNNVSITSLDGKRELDLTSSLLSTDYFEDILQPCVSATLTLVSSYNIVEQLPIRGGEKVDISINTYSGEFTKSFRVYKVGDITTQKMKETFTLHLVPQEYHNNEVSRCMKKYSGTISETVHDILTTVLRTKEPLFIEPTSNVEPFIATIKKPFWVINWLAPKSISAAPNSGQGEEGGEEGEKGVEKGYLKKKGKGTAGFLFYQNRDGFHFRSIDTLVSQNNPASADLKKIFNYSHGEVIKSNDPDNIFKVIDFVFEKNIDVRKTLKVGMYSNRTINFNPIDHQVSIIDYNLQEEIKKGSKKEVLGSEEKISVPISEEEQLVSETLSPYAAGQQSPSRNFVSISNHGVFNVNGGTPDQGREQAAFAKAYSRYNLLFTQGLNILVPCNINLKVGEVIRLEFKELSSGNENAAEVDAKTSGLYLIKELRHHFSSNQNTTSLKLVRDSYGQRNNNTI